MLGMSDLSSTAHSEEIQEWGHLRDWDRLGDVETCGGLEKMKGHLGVIVSWDDINK